MKNRFDSQSRKENWMAAIILIAALLGDVLLGLFVQHLGPPYTEIIMAGYTILIVLAAIVWLLSRGRDI